MRELFETLYTKTQKEYYIKLSKYLDNNEKKFIVTANPEMFKLASTDCVLKNILLDSDNDVVPDGIAIVKGARRFGLNIEERITGIDISIKLLELLNNKKKTLYLFGAKSEVLDKIGTVIKEKYPCIKVLGMTDGYVDNKDEVFQNIIDLNPDGCLVALGIPAQEKLIAKHFENVKRGIYIGVGGSLDVISGSKKRAPQIFIKLNLEWLYRIIKEPSRIGRFIKNNIGFMIDVFREKRK